MALGDPIYTSNIQSGVFFEQPGSSVTETLDGWDSGIRSWLTHPDTTRDNSNYPSVGQTYPTHPFLFVTDVETVIDESGLKLITATYRGAVRINGGQVVKPHFLLPGVSTQVVNIPALTGGGSSEKRTLIVPVPTPTLTRVVLTTDTLYRDQPFFAVGNLVTADYLPPPGTWGITYLPDPDSILPTNYYNGWVLMSRGVEPAVHGLPTANKIWRLQEEYQWFWQIAS